MDGKNVDRAEPWYTGANVGHGGRATRTMIGKVSYWYTTQNHIQYRWWTKRYICTVRVQWGRKRGDPYHFFILRSSEIIYKSFWNLFHRHPHFHGTPIPRISLFHDTEIAYSYLRNWLGNTATAFVVTIRMPLPSLVPPLCIVAAKLFVVLHATCAYVSVSSSSESSTCMCNTTPVNDMDRVIGYLIRLTIVRNLYLIGSVVIVRFALFDLVNTGHILHKFVIDGRFKH